MTDSFGRLIKDGKVLTASLHRAPLNANPDFWVSGESQRKPDFFFYYLVTLSDKQGRPLVNTEFYYQLNFDKCVASYHYIPSAVFEFSGDALNAVPITGKRNVYRGKTDANGEFLFGGLATFPVSDNRAVLKEKNASSAVTFFYALDFILAMNEDGLNHPGDYLSLHVELFKHTAPEPLTFSHFYPALKYADGDMRKLSDRLEVDVNSENSKFNAYFGYDPDNLSQSTPIPVDENHRVTMPFTTEDIDGREVWATVVRDNDYSFLAAPIKCRDKDEAISVEPYEGANIALGQTLNVTFRYQLKKGEVLAPDFNPFTVNYGDSLYPAFDDEVRYWTEGNNIYGQQMLIVDDSTLVKGDILSWKVTVSLNDIDPPVSTRNINWLVAFDDNDYDEMHFNADNYALINYANNESLALSERPAMTWRIFIPGLKNTQVFFYSLSNTVLSLNAYVTDDSFDEIRPVNQSTGSSEIYFIMLDDNGEAEIHLQPKNNRTILTGFSYGIYGIGSVEDTLDFFLNSSWQPSEMPAVHIDTDRDPQDRPEDESYALANFPFISDWQMMSDRDLFGADLFLFAGEEKQHKNTFTPLALLGRVRLPLKATPGGVPEIAMYFTESNFETDKIYYVHACFVENAYKHSGMNYIRLQESSFTLVTAKPPVPEHVKRTYAAPVFILKDGTVIDHDYFTITKNDLSRGGLEYRILLNGDGKHLIVGDVVEVTAYLHTWNKLTNEMENSNPPLKLNKPYRLVKEDIDRGYLKDIIKYSDLAHCDSPPDDKEHSTICIDYYCSNTKEYSLLRDDLIDVVM